jgi:hypothetical protein
LDENAMKDVRCTKWIQHVSNGVSWRAQTDDKFKLDQVKQSCAEVLERQIENI